MRNLDDLTIGPVLTWDTERILKHIQDCLAVPGATLAFGGSALSGHSIPSCYGAVEPTAVTIPLKAMLDDPAVFKLATTVREVGSNLAVYHFERCLLTARSIRCPSGALWAVSGERRVAWRCLGSRLAGPARTALARVHAGR